QLHVSTIELDAPELPYAVETVDRMKNDAERMFFLIGADSWAELSTWHEWQKLTGMCDLIVVTRPGYEINVTGAPTKVVDLRSLAPQSIKAALRPEDQRQVFITDVAMVDASATRIRTAVQTNDLAGLRAMVPPVVARYIEKYNLYRN